MLKLGPAGRFMVDVEPLADDLKATTVGQWSLKPWSKAAESSGW